ncbi:anti-sigma factor [Peribacillus saganii]|uniref:Anti-sigma-W factor RsiW n=1 Tax=Peribacillus saganii TaxID=2303992 RepID=A0A372LPJ7_9BACI|nr:anti-sigma factor [Peribacillus saganii]RFU69971.1 anti-sigma factor [Peribacillus saganii]
MKCPNEAIEYMHEYLDEEISEENKELLKKHLQECEDCRNYFHELKKAIALVQSTSHIAAPADFTARVMANLPEENKKVKAKRWFRNHPFLTAAAMFFVLMSGTVLSTWNQDQQFSFSKQPSLVVENGTVIVPKGKTVEGDIVVRNGDIKVEGRVKGNVTVINGKQYMASAGNVTGEIEEVDQLFEWLWYNIKGTGKEVLDINENEEKK